MRHSFPLTAYAIVLCLSVASGLANGPQARPKYPYKFLIPEGYVGWVRVDFYVQGAPALPIEEGYYVIKVPDTGRLSTSSPDMLARGDEYYYYSDDTKYRLAVNSQSPVRMIQDQFMGPPPGYSTPKPYRYFFVGPREEYEKCKFNEPCNKRDKDGFLLAGPQILLTRERLEQLNIRQP